MRGICGGVEGVALLDVTINRLSNTAANNPATIFVFIDVFSTIFSTKRDANGPVGVVSVNGLKVTSSAGYIIGRLHHERSHHRRNADSHHR
jgi:hypothetical protein